MQNPRRWDIVTPPGSVGVGASRRFGSPRKRPSWHEAVLKLSFFFLLISCLLSRPLFAATAVSSVKLVDQDAGANTAKVMFNLTNESGGDWVWIFAKYSLDPGSNPRTWNHCTIATSGHTAGGATTITIPSDKKGAFIEGSGTGTKLVWEYGTDGVSDAAVKTAGFRIRVFVIDMIKVPTGSFYLGETPGGGEFGCGPGCEGLDTSSCPMNPSCTSCGLPGDSWAQSPGVFFGAELYDCQGAGIVRRQAFSVTSESVISMGYMDAYGSGSWQTGYLIYQSAEAGGDGAGQLEASFPKGYAGFYFMEHELSQGQYRDFLNTLTRTQQGARVTSGISTNEIDDTYVMTGTSSISDRNTISAPASGNGETDPVTFGCNLDGDTAFDESDDGEWIAMNYMSWNDLLAYADWAGLRPMTELEYEKAASGAGGIYQYPWAASYVVYSTIYEPLGSNASVNSYVTDAGTIDELVSGGADNNVNYLVNWGDDFTGYPFRSGAFYGDGNSWNSALITPEGPYGGYDLSGNVSEMVVTVGSQAGRSFDGSHGDGALDSGGSHTNSMWQNGFILRGGNWATLSGSPSMRTGNRSEGSQAANARSNTVGGRLARTAPS